MNPYERKPARRKHGEDRREQQKVEAEKFLLRYSTTQELVATALDTKNSTRRRISALLAVPLYLIRGAREKALLALHKDNDFSVLANDPNFDPDAYEIKEVLGVGHWNVAYLLEPKREGLKRRVLKMEYPAEEHPRQKIEQELTALKGEYDFLRNVFNRARLPELVPHTEFLIMKSPRTGKTAIAQYQEYAGEDAFDPMAPSNRERMRRLLDSEDRFREEFEVFKREMMRLRQTKEEPDLAGGGNLLVVARADGSHTLLFIDPYRVHPDFETVQELQEHALEYLRSL